ncbi:MAG: GNAT family N-acetyltransferase [Lachnospiraceae bacterium]|nr:GNAT family N-acetyltransferase [Lachnospiraceae bacterium]
MKEIQTERLLIVPFDLNYLNDYYLGFDAEITQYQYPDPFESKEAAGKLLQEFIDEMNQGEMLFLAILDKKGEFAGGLEVHGLAEEYPELGVWLKKDFQGKGYAYEALYHIIQHLNQTDQKKWYIYEADIRNKSSIGLVAKFAYQKEGLDEFTTESGKELKLQRYLINIKE